MRSEAEQKAFEADQLAKINNVMKADADTIPKYTFSFGKYAGTSLDTVACRDKQYLVYLYNNESTNLPDEVMAYIDEELI